MAGSGAASVRPGACPRRPSSPASPPRCRPERHPAVASPRRRRPSPVAGQGWGSKHYHGHRERLRQRFATTTPDALADYELLELLLFFSVRRRDTKPLAKEMLARFGGLSGVLATDPARYVECGDLAILPEAVNPERRADRDDRPLLHPGHA